MLTWTFDGILLDGPAPLRAYGLLLSLALVVAFLIWRSRLLRLGVSDRSSGELLGLGLLAALLGARLAHAFVYEPARFLAHPLELLAVWRGGLASHGALVGLALVVFLVGRRRRLGFARLADPLCIGAALASTLVRVGNFCNSEIVGRPTSGSWGVRFPRHDWHLPLADVPPRHPVQLYEAALGILVFLILLRLERRAATRPGLLAALFLLLLFGGRLVLEIWKVPEGPLSTSAPFTLGQLLSVAPALAGLIWLALLLRRPAI